jgi:hypothetical protein
VKRLKGPDLKMPELKVPAFLVDLYYDLRDRRLLPLVALAIVAIVAVPFLLGGDPEIEVQPSGPGGASISAVGTRSAELAVVEAKPGLRDYRKRLRSRQPTDPFEQRYTSPVLEGTELGGEGSPGGSETSTSVTKTSKSVTKTTKTTEGDTTKTTTTTTTDGTGADAGGDADGELTLFSFGIDAKIVRTVTNPDGGKEKHPKTYRRVTPPTALPSAETQVVTYMGISPETGKPLLLVSDEVTAVYGEAKCLSGASTCQLLEVDLGLPIVFIFGPNGARYKITVLDVEPVVAAKPASGQE